MSTVTQLEAVHVMLSHGWIQDHYAVDKAGNICQPRSAAACAWCVAGAMAAAKTGVEAFHALSAEISGVHTLVSYNDEPGRTQAAMLRLVEQAIKRVKA